MTTSVQKPAAAIKAARSCIVTAKTARMKAPTTLNSKMNRAERRRAIASKVPRAAATRSSRSAIGLMLGCGDGGSGAEAAGADGAGAATLLGPGAGLSLST